MRLVIAFLALLALLVGPVTTAAAQSACGRDGSVAMAGMGMPTTLGPTHAVLQKTASDPCCDHGKHGRISNKSCGHACAASCVATAALPTPLASVDLAFARAPTPLARLASVQGHEPAGLERPPKSIA
jgi:hypothetical protein